MDGSKTPTVGVWLFLGWSEILHKNSGVGSKILQKNSRGVAVLRDIPDEVIYTKVHKNPLNSHITSL